MSEIKISQFEYAKMQDTPLSLPAAGELHIWWADTDENPHKSGESRRILRSLLSRCLQVPEADIRIKTGAHGKPYLAAGAADVPLFFNLSHAGTKMVLAFSTSSEVGIDLESLDHTGDADAIAARFFHPDEIVQLASLSGEEKKKKFFSFWTQKEAFLKGTGEGLTRETNSFTFDPLPDGSLQAKKCLREADASWRLYEIAAPAGYACTAAVSTAESNDSV